MIAAAIGAVTGLFFFFHGFSLLQEHRLSAARTMVKAADVGTSATTATNLRKPADSGKREPRAEVIKLSSSENPPNDASSMSQQAKIAAALMKAGIPNPMAWSAHEEVRVIDPPSEPESSPAAKEAEVSRVLQQSASAESVRLPSRKGSDPMDWKTRLMIWGGPALTLACIYTLAAHFGWL